MAEEKRGVGVVPWVALVVAVVGAVAAAVAMVTLELRRAEEVRHLEERLESLRHLVEAMGQQLEYHDKMINTTLYARKTAKNEPAEEVVYEDEYDYDGEDEYEYDDEDDKRNTKATVKRTAVLSENTSDTSAVSGGERRHKRHVDESTTYSGDSQIRPIQQIPQTHPPIFQERPQETVRYRHKNSRARSRNSDRESSVEYSSELLQGGESSAERRSRMVAAHFTGDTSRYNQRDHRHYYGNNILYHPHNLFKDWTPASWMTEEDIRNFPIQDGKIRILKSGLYFVYAQIFYSTTHSHCGFHIKRNGEEVAQCTVSGAGPALKRNTCYTGLALRLARQDSLWLAEVEGHRNTSFRDTHSYFGLVGLRLGPT